MMRFISAFEPGRWVAAIPAVVCCAMVGACSASSDGGAGGTGGSAGAFGAGGVSGASGSAGTGGGQSSGGAPSATGGAPSVTGGAPSATGGAPTATGGAPTATGGAPSLGDSGAAGGSTGACTNTADEALINGASFDKTSTDCGTSCFVNLDPTGCAATCMAKAGLSQGCAACYGADIECGIAQCAGPCAADSASAACRDCVTQHCDPAFIACAGSP